MGYTFRLATEADIEALLELTTRAYEPIRELGIQFQAAHADFALVQKNVQKNLCYVMEENGELLSTLSSVCLGRAARTVRRPSYLVVCLRTSRQKRHRLSLAGMGGNRSAKGYTEGAVRVARYS